MTFSKKYFLTTAALICAAASTQANNLQDSNGIYEVLTDEKQLFLSKNANLSLGGWISAGGNYNPDAQNGSGNAPVSFNYRANEFNLEQLNLFIERPISTDTHQWQIGGRFDFMFGLDSPYTQATGHWDTRLLNDKTSHYYKIALPQLYTEIFAPIGNGISTKIGHFYGPIGYESVASPNNFFYSHSYSFKSSPFTHTGVLLSYPMWSNFNFYSGAVTGADNFDQNFGAWSYLGGFNWNSENKKTTFTASVLTGGVSDTINDDRTYLSLVLQQQFTDKLHYVLQHDNGWQTNAFGANTQKASWYSIVNYLNYDINNRLGIGLRHEWFNDQQGFRYGAGKASYYETTLGLNWKPFNWLMMRPEIRYDWAESPNKVFDAHTKNHQLIVGADFVIQF